MRRTNLAAWLLYGALALTGNWGASAQDIPNHSMPVGRGPGAVGWVAAGPCNSGQALVWSNSSSDPACATVSAITGQALTASNDTNVTLTLGGSPSTALVTAASITAGWSGQLAVARGGTNCGVASGTCVDNISGFASTGYIKRTGAGTYNFIGTIPITDGGTGSTTQQAALNAIAPTPTRAGDLITYNGTNWVDFAGNNVGTKVLQSDSSGNLSWVTAGAGTVTSVTCATTIITGSGTCYSRGQIVGTNTNDNATAGNFGEFVNATLASGSAVSLTNNTAANVTSISLTAGDWDVWGGCSFQGNVATNVGYVGCSSSATSATFAASDGMNGVLFGYANQTVFNFTSSTTIVTGPVRYSLSGTTTVFLVALSGFSTSTESAFGQIRARRVR